MGKLFELPPTQRENVYIIGKIMIKTIDGRMTAACHHGGEGQALRAIMILFTKEYFTSRADAAMIGTDKLRPYLYETCLKVKPDQQQNLFE